MKSINPVQHKLLFQAAFHNVYGLARAKAQTFHATSAEPFLRDISYMLIAHFDDADWATLDADIAAYALFWINSYKASV